MINVSRQKILIVLSLFIVSFVYFLPNKVEAITVSPTRIEVSVDPGQTVIGEYKLINENDFPQTLHGSFNNFEAQGETGIPSFVDYDGTGLASWIDGPKEISLDPNETEVVRYSVSVPENVDPGGYFSAMFWGTGSPNEGEDDVVNIDSKIGILLLVSVNGDIVEDGELLEFGTLENKSFYSSIPVKTFFRYQNGGGDKIKPVGNIQVRNIFGFKSAKFDANPSLGNILPRQTRKISSQWGDLNVESPSGFFKNVKYQLKNFRLGVYTLKLSLGFDSSDLDPVNEKVRVVIFPWQLVLTVLVISFIVYKLIKIYLAIYKKRIIKNLKENTNL